MSLFRKLEGKVHEAEAAHAAREAEQAAYTTAVMKLAEPGSDTAALLAALPPVPAFMGPQQAAAVKLQAVAGLANALLEDERLTPAEEAQLTTVADGLAVSMDALLQHEPGLGSKFAIGRINDGRLPQLAAAEVQLVLKKGEVAHLTANVILAKEQVTREFRGASRGMSFRLAKGVYYRTGQFKGHSVVTGTALVAADTGVLTVTSERTVFSGSRASLEFAYAKLLDITGYSDGVKLAVSNRQKPSTFQFRGAADEVLAVLHAAVTNFQS